MSAPGIQLWTSCHPSSLYPFGHLCPYSSFSVPVSPSSPLPSFSQHHTRGRNKEACVSWPTETFTGCDFSGGRVWHSVWFRPVQCPVKCLSNILYIEFTSYTPPFVSHCYPCSHLSAHTFSMAVKHCPFLLCIPFIQPLLFDMTVFFSSPPQLQLDFLSLRSFLFPLMSVSSSTLVPSRKVDPVRTGADLWQLSEPALSCLYNPKESLHVQVSYRRPHFHTSCPQCFRK